MASKVTRSLSLRSNALDKENAQDRILKSKATLGEAKPSLVGAKGKFNNNPPSRAALVENNGRRPVKKEPAVKGSDKVETNCKRDKVDEEVQIAPVITRRVQDFPVLPPGVADIEREEENPQLCAEYTPFIYLYLRQQEQEQFIRKDFLKTCLVTGKMRAVLLDWLIEVHHQFKLLQETLYMTIFLIDRYLQVEGHGLKRTKFQLLGVTAMFTASKFEEMYAPEINDFVYITDNAFTSKEIRQMELKLLQALQFKLGRPLPLHFLRRNSKAGDVDLTQHTAAKYIVELAQLQYELAHLPPSMIAAAALYLSLVALTPGCSLTTCVWSPSLEHYSFYTRSQLLPVVCQLAALVYRSGEGKLLAVHTKYTTKKLLQVALMPELKSPIVRQLAEKHLNSLK